jgi:hypothetical protein
MSSPSSALHSSLRVALAARAPRSSAPLRAGLAYGLVTIALRAGETPANERVGRNLMIAPLHGIARVRRNALRLLRPTFTVGCGTAAAAGMRLRSGFAATEAATIAFAVRATLAGDNIPRGNLPARQYAACNN